MNGELKPCPFCGSSAELGSVGPSGRIVNCSNADCPVGAYAIGDTDKEVQDAWNTRKLGMSFEEFNAAVIDAQEDVVALRAIYDAGWNSGGEVKA